MTHIMDNFEMSDSETFKERFTTDNLKMPDSKTTKNKEEILETILKTLTRKEN